MTGNDVEEEESPSDAWVRDCMRLRGRRLDGKQGHYCLDWDELPVDETCAEWPCTCFNIEGACVI